jgi:hypothetical protein
MELVIEAAAAPEGGLAEALREAERLIEERRPRAVRVVDDSDFALAAVLVALKLHVAVEATSAASESPSANGRLIAQLARAYTAPG